MKPKFVALDSFFRYPVEEMKDRSDWFLNEMLKRRTVRHFSTTPVPIEVIKNCLQVACTAPSGANRQPWKFVVIEDENLKKEIRKHAEVEERNFYLHRAPTEWLKALEPLGTDPEKPFLTTAPQLIAVFAETYGWLEDGTKIKNYYATESVGIATGMLITALHLAGLVTLTHTPSPMGFLNRILGRPKNERAFLILVTGYPSDNATVPIIDKNPLEKSVVWL
ncbi:nitroreductase family protein [SAR202 cluster bacterium AC-409-J13_OGT_754m]|nr:nitroreductase family protein [SAR202 cluster bacterium AC-409-J13_OGT_754m]